MQSREIIFYVKYVNAFMFAKISGGWAIAPACPFLVAALFGGIFCLTFFREGCSPAVRLDKPSPGWVVSFVFSGQERLISNM